MNNERLAKGLRRHLREELAEARNSGSLDGIERMEDSVAITRLSFHYPRQLEELKEKIEAVPEGSLDQITFTLRKFWLEYKITNVASRSVKLKEIAKYLTSVEDNYPKVYADLIQEVAKDAKGKSITMMIDIRNQVIPLEEFKRK